MTRNCSSFLPACSRLLATSMFAASLFVVTSAIHAQSPEMLAKLNAPWALVTENGKSATRLFTAYLDLTKSPVEVGEEFNQTTIYPGMTGFAEVAKWAEANSMMGKALIDLQNCQVLGVPYGTTGVDPRFVERGLTATVQLDGELVTVNFPYLQALDTISAYVAAEMYRLAEAGKFDEGFTIGVAHLRVLRQAVDATMYGEKSAAMTMLCEALSVHRDLLYVYRDKMTVDALKKLATKEYPFLKPSENERFKRLSMPEGDLIVAEAVLNTVFSQDGQPDLEKFAKTFSVLQSQPEPLTAFGAAKRWSKIATVHGSLEASNKKLTDIYDDWWRRWRMRAYDPMQSLPTELSRANPVKYAAVVLVARDIESLFELRRRLGVEVSGTIIAAGLCGYRNQFDTWPDKIEKSYTQFFPQRYDFDPYDKDYGRLLYTYLGSAKKGIDSSFGRIEVKNCVLYARNGDGESNSAARHAVGGKSDDFVVFPPLRAISRGQAQ